MVTLLGRVGFTQEVRLTRQIDPTDRVVVTPRLHPLAAAGTDQGAIPGTAVLHGMVIEFRRTTQQQAELEQLLAAQQDRGSPEYHRWLTPEQFGERFGVAPADADSVRQWLENEGFQIDESSRSRTFIRFSGTAQQVSKSFSSEIHTFLAGGQRHFAPASAVSIPSGFGSSHQRDSQPRQLSAPGTPSENKTCLFRCGYHRLACARRLSNYLRLSIAACRRQRWNRSVGRGGGSNGHRP